MNWDAVGAIAELLAALGVVVSFFYLATQIRLNTKQVSESIKSQQIAASQAVQTAGFEVRAQILANPAVYLKGLRDPASLNTEEPLKFSLVMQGVIVSIRQLYLLHHWGTIDPFLWAINEDFIRTLASEPGGRDALEPFLADSTEFGSELKRIFGTMSAPAARQDASG